MKSQHLLFETHNKNISTMLIWKCLWSHLNMIKVFFKDCKLLHITLAKVGSNLSAWIINRDYLQRVHSYRDLLILALFPHKAQMLTVLLFQCSMLNICRRAPKQNLLNCIYMYNIVWWKNIQRIHAKGFQVVLRFIQDHITWDLSWNSNEWIVKLIIKLTSNEWREGRKCVLQNFRK